MTLKSTRFSFIIAISILGFLHVFFGISLWWLVLPAVIALSVIVYGSAIIQANFYGTACCHGLGSEKEIALSFDDGPNSKYTPQILAALAEHHVTATFFVIGQNIHGNDSVLKQLYEAGHCIGNHSYTHSHFVDLKGVQGFKDELNQAAESVFKVIGKRMKLFRPPYGVTTPSIIKAAQELNYSIIGWTIRSFDTTGDSAQTIIERVQRQIKPGAIILFHDTSDKTVEVLKQTLKFAEENGYKIVSIERLLNIEAYE
jgi:peptidoglycan/xylan/chitin deacetylase (PgdA/CDA1 family)